MNHSPFKNHHTMIRVVGVIAALFGLVTAASGAARYSLTDLGTLGGPYAARGAALNERGQVTGYAPTGSTNQFFRPLIHAFLYSNGALNDLGTLGGTGSSGTAINERGQVTGAAETAGNGFHAFIYTRRTGMVDLNTLLAPGSAAPGFYLFGGVINDEGLILADGSDGHSYLLKPQEE